MKKLLIFALLLAGCGPVDNSDPPGGRSGFEVFTDNLTGCQYIGFSGVYGKALTPRLAADGKQICSVSDQLKKVMP